MNHTLLVLRASVLGIACLAGCTAILGNDDEVIRAWEADAGTPLSVDAHSNREAGADGSRAVSLDAEREATQGPDVADATAEVGDSAPDATTSDAPSETGEPDARDSGDATVCAPESDAELCGRLGRSCGAASATDNCGMGRNVASCGGCASGASCNAAGACVVVGDAAGPEAGTVDSLWMVVGGDAGVLRVTSNGGKDWTTRSSGTGGNVASLEYGGGVLVLHESGGNLRRSTDNASTWSAVTIPSSSGLDRWYSGAALRYLGGRWFLGGLGRIWTSEDGNAWTLRYDNANLLDGYGKPTLIGSFARIGSEVMAATIGEGYPYTLRSFDGGLQWGSVVQASPSNMPGVGTNCASTLIGATTRWYAQSSSYCDGIVYNAADLWYNTSTGAGSAWTNTTPAQGMYPQISAIGVSSNRVMFLGASAGMYQCDRYVSVGDDGTITQGSIPTFGTPSCAMKVVHVDGRWIGTTGTRVMQSTTDGAVWDTIDPGIPPTAIAAWTGTTCVQSDAELCSAAGRSCGPLSATDRCGAMRDVTSCGSCGAGLSCNSAGGCETSDAGPDSPGPGIGKPTFAIRSTALNGSISVVNTGFGVGRVAWTFEYWVRVHDSFGPGGALSGGRLFDMNENYAAYAIRPTLANRTLCAHTYNDTSGPHNLGLCANALDASDSSWHHVAFTYDGGSTAVLFLDGKSVRTQTGVAPDIRASSPMAIGRPAGYSSYDTAPVSLGGIRYSRGVRYSASTSFQPASTWAIDGNTIAQYLTTVGLSGTTLTDEAGNDNTGTVRQGWVADTP